MKSLKERQAQRALRAIAASKGEDISHILEDEELTEAKAAAVRRNEREADVVPEAPQRAIGPIRSIDVSPGVSKQILDEDGNVLVDGDTTTKTESSEGNKASAATVKAAKAAAAAAPAAGWTANAPAAGNGGGEAKK